MASTTPRGIQEIQWNRKDGSVGTAFRVRITRKNFKGQRSRVFDNLNEAKEYLALSKTVQGKKLIYSVEKTEEEKYREDKENRNNFSFRVFADEYDSRSKAAPDSIRRKRCSNEVRSSSTNKVNPDTNDLFNTPSNSFIFPPLVTVVPVT